MEYGVVVGIHHQLQALTILITYKYNLEALKDFGDLTEGGNQMRANSSSTRGVFIGGRRPHAGVVNVMDYVELATLGNALDFGDLLNGRGDCW